MLNRYLGWLVALMVVVTLASSTFKLRAFHRPGEAKPEVGFLAPDFALTDLDGKPVKLSDLRGKVVFLNIWATWCGPCRIEMPEMKRLHEQQMPDLAIVAVNMTDTERGPQAVREFMDLFGYRFTVPLDQDGSVTRLYRAVSIPTSFFLNGEGVIVAKHIGPMTLSQMESYVKMAREVR